VTLLVIVKSDRARHKYDLHWREFTTQYCAVKSSNETQMRIHVQDILYMNIKQAGPVILA